MQLADEIEGWALDNASSLTKDDRLRLRLLWSVVRRSPEADIDLVDLSDESTATIIELFDEHERAEISRTLDRIVSSRGADVHDARTGDNAGPLGDIDDGADTEDEFDSYDDIDDELHAFDDDDHDDFDDDIDDDHHEFDDDDDDHLDDIDDEHHELDDDDDDHLDDIDDLDRADGDDDHDDDLDDTHGLLGEGYLDDGTGTRPFSEALLPHDHVDGAVTRSLPADVAKSQGGVNRAVLWIVALVVLLIIGAGVASYIYFVGL